MRANPDTPFRHLLKFHTLAFGTRTPREGTRPTTRVFQAKRPVGRVPRPGAEAPNLEVAQILRCGPPLMKGLRVKLSRNDDFFGQHRGRAELRLSPICFEANSVMFSWWVHPAFDARSTPLRRSHLYGAETQLNPTTTPCRLHGANWRIPISLSKITANAPGSSCYG
jgi:hypothetical protein